MAKNRYAFFISIDRIIDHEHIYVGQFGCTCHKVDERNQTKIKCVTKKNSGCGTILLYIPNDYYPRSNSSQMSTFKLQHFY